LFNRLSIYSFLALGIEALFELFFFFNKKASA